ncbi:uncharacterized protein LOC135501170 isoform X2 [Lineus longissimus]|uniref:uncharacterized protein LOC135501170 isoform X2 n=1 Tax=Lineus longissimus TaxID=88925 RepID=UPI00315DCE26
MLHMCSGRFHFLLLSLGLLQVQLIHGALGITVKNSLSNSHPRLGETITLNCTIADGITKNVTWYKDKFHKTSVYLTHNCEVVAEGYKSRLKLVQCGINIERFQLSNVQISDRGDWQCEADGVRATTNLKLYVLVPHNVQVKVSKTTVNEHEFVRFECITSNPELVTRYMWLWTKNGSIAKQVIQDSDTSTKNGKFVEFPRIPYDKSGTYSCMAWNDAGMGQASAVLNVQYSPRIDPGTKMKFDVVGEIGKEAMFKLFIIANPTPVTTGYTWSKDGNVLSQTSPDFEITSAPTSSKLKINDVKSSDYTNYSCSVKTSGFQGKVFNFKLVKAVSYTSDLSNSVPVNTTVSYTSDLSNCVPVNTTVAVYFVFGFICAVIFLWACLALAQWKRRLNLKRSKKITGPANDSNDDAARNEVISIRKRPDHANNFVNDASSHSKRTTDKYPAQPMVRPPVSVRFEKDQEEPACSGDILDVYSYDYVVNEWQSNESGSDHSPVPACRTSQATYQIDRDDPPSHEGMHGLGHCVSCEGKTNQTAQEPEGNYNDVRNVRQGQSGQNTAERGTSPACLAKESTPYGSYEDVAYPDQQSYEHLQPVSKNDYLDFRGLSANN